MINITAFMITSPKSNSTTYGLKSFKHDGNKIRNQLSVDIKTSENLAIFKIKINKWHKVLNIIPFLTVFIHCIFF